MAKRSKKRVRHLTLFLLKPEIQQFKNALKDLDSLTLCKLRDDSPFQGRFYYQPPQQKPPGWQALVQSGLADKLNLHNQSTAAVLFVRAAGRRFALTFGYGRNLLKPDSFERNFGLKVALNTVDPKNLKSVDARTFEDLTLVTRRQASRGSELSAFGSDVAQDVLRAVTGRPRDAYFAKQVTGADALAVAVEAESRELASVCKRAFEAYGRDDYKKDFGFIDHLRPVADPSLKSTLEAALIDALKSGNTDRIHLAPPEPLDWERVDGFLYSTQGDEDAHSDLDIDDYLATFDDATTLSLADVRRHRIAARFSGGTDAHEQWSVHDSIVFETEIGDHLYVLSAGDWYEVAKSFAQSVANRLKKVKSPALMLPNADASDSEGDYNQSVATSEKFALMDQKLVRARDANSDIELCDLLTPNRQLIHVKKKTRSATLSHLFAQGVVAAEAFLWDEEFRKAARSKIPATQKRVAALIPDDKPESKEFEVIYAIITKMAATKWPAGLPFFSQLNLVNAAERLRRHGFRVSLLRIQETQ
ncbi:MAG: hypothetical protein DCC65_07805 [Planctomycetota bacterium]|nr:MAG: hypothetical protein DCC65_07805 [Planctomycetota bacterium]